MVAKMPGLGGELSSKELCVIVAVSKNNSIARVGRFSLPFGQGAKNGAKTFLKVPLKAGRAPAPRTIRITWPSSVPSWRRPSGNCIHNFLPS